MGRAIDKLLTQVENKRQPLERRVSPEILKRIDADLRAVIEHVATGNVEPTRYSIARYLTDEYGVTIGPDAVRTRLNFLKVKHARQKVTRKR